MIVSAAGNQCHAFREKRRRQRLRIAQRGLRVRDELGRRRLLERDRGTGDVVHVRPALQTWKDRTVDLRRVGRFAQDQSAARSAQRLVSCGRNHIETRIETDCA